jgi:hypothetical protein
MQSLAEYSNVMVRTALDKCQPKPEEQEIKFIKCITTQATINTFSLSLYMLCEQNILRWGDYAGGTEGDKES